jgi:hypothetical protein
MERYQRHSSYIISRMLLIYMLIEIAYFVTAAAFDVLYNKVFWNWLFLTIPVIATIALMALINAVFNPGKSRLGARFAAQMSLISLLVASGTFAILIGTLQ